MRKSIIRNLLLGSFIVIGIVFTLMFLYVTMYVESFAVSEKAKSLISNVDEIEDRTYIALNSYTEQSDYILQDTIDIVASSTQSSVKVYDCNGFVVASSGEKKNSARPEKIEDKISKRVLEGEFIITTGMYRDQNNDKVLTVSAPLIHDNKIFGGVVFNQRVPEIKGMYIVMAQRMSMLISIALVLVAILFLLLSFKITSPVKKISAAVMEFSKGNFKKRVEYTSDNELGELADNINHMASSLDNLENLRKGFISDVSHELRTPLTTISGFVEGILDGTIPEESRDEYLEVVLSESKRLSRLITNLLQVSRMESGEAKLERKDFDINDLVCVSLLKFEMMITPKNIDVSLNIDEGKLMVNADKDNISQVLINLINNAVKFTPKNGTISIDIKQTRDKAIVSITNSGHGIEPEKLNYIWDRFYKADTSRGEDRTGMGLGLYIVKRIIGMHGENIKVESVVDEYTKFSFTLAKSRKNEKYPSLKGDKQKDSEAKDTKE